MAKLTFKDGLWGFLKRFTLVHLLTYLVFGLLFYVLFGYSERFASAELSALMRPTDSPLVRAAVLFQFVRGPLLGLALYPFRKVITGDRWGWLKLWGALWVLTGIGSATAGLGSIEGIIYTRLPLSQHLFGYPEVTLQMLAFSFLFFLWERKAARADAAAQ